uniref:NIF3-like protein 1 n=1 Tax=Oncorhynchus kisutch TaxID=8019 RepID=A0A8C7GGB7_ONCKI
MVGDLYFLFIFYLKCFKQSIWELYSSLVGGSNATFIGCQLRLNLIEEEGNCNSWLSLHQSTLMLTGYKNVFQRILSLTCRRSYHESISQTLACSTFSSHSKLSALRSSFFSDPSHCNSPMDLKEVLKVLEELAPLSLAESWDNVGLLVEPIKCRPIKTILLTNDLTDSVMSEAEAMNCDLIISYHPPLFHPIKCLVSKNWKQRLAIRAITAGIAVFSPHTSWDSVKGGVNDWLAGGVGSGKVSVLSQSFSSAPQSHKLEFTARSLEELNTIMAELKGTNSGVNLQHTAVSSETDGFFISLICPDSGLTPSVQTLLQHATPSQSLSILQVKQRPLPGYGQGRLSVLDEPVTVAAAVQQMKSHLGLNHLRLALGAQQTLESIVSTVAVCAGSGGSVLNGVKADLYITGEMSHHEVLDSVAAGASVILSDHSNSERGFLAVFKKRLAGHLSNSITVALSQADRDPLEVV